MNIIRGLGNRVASTGCALTIGNFDGVHRGHQAMLALLNNEARHRGLRSVVMSFEPHPRDWFAARAGQPELAPRRIATLRDKLQELERCGVDEVVLLRFDEALASMPPLAFIEDVLVRRLNTRYVLVGDDFRFGARRAGDYALLDAEYQAAGPGGDGDDFAEVRCHPSEQLGQRLAQPRLVFHHQDPLPAPARRCLGHAVFPCAGNTRETTTPPSCGCSISRGRAAP